MQFDYELKTRKPFCKVEPTMKGRVRIQLDCHEAEVDLTISREALQRLALAALITLGNSGGAFVSESGELFHMTGQGNVPVTGALNEFAKTLCPHEQKPD